MNTGSTPLLLSPNIDIRVDISSAPADLLSSVSHTKSFLLNDNLQRLIVGRGSSDLPLLHNASTLSTLTLRLASTSDVKSISEEAVVALDKRSEGYTLFVPDNGDDAILTANSTLGLLHGLTTFQQLWYTYQDNIYTLETPINIVDGPAFSYRGFMLDTSRNFFPVPDIMRTLDAMSWVKLNTLYWHVVDSHSFPLEVSIFPELSAAGAYSATSIYTQGDVQNVIAYAAERGIDVVLELDTPGHETAIGQSHPEHIACFEASPWSEFASEPPAGQLRLATPSTINFTVQLLTSVSRAFPSTLFSTGGDELNANCYTQDEQTQVDLQGRTLDEALNVFIQALQSVLLEQGKMPIIKEDMILNHNITVSNETVAVIWISSQDAKSIAERNLRMIHQPSNYFYLDCGGGEWVGDDILGNSWCDPFKTWQRIYSFDPYANLTVDESKLVLGGQIPLWTEQSGPENLDPIVWPRAASAAEVFWTGALLPDGSPRNVTSALSRLHEMRFRMVNRGIKAIPLQPEWCAIRPGLCNLNS